MNKQIAREPTARVFEGHDALSPAARGRAPRVFLWGPIAAKVALAVFAAAVLALIGVKAGARSEPTVASSPGAAGPGAEPVLAASAGPQLAAAHPDDMTAPHPEESASPLDGGVETSAGILPDGRVILNVASADELTKLPGIGPSRAHAIVTLRQRLARFRALEDLLRVKGIGRKTLGRLRPKLVLDRPKVAEGGAP